MIPQKKDSNYGLQEKKSESGEYRFVVDEALWERLLEYVDTTGYDGDYLSDAR